MSPTIDRRRKPGRSRAGEAPERPNRERMPHRALGAFFALAFALTWGLAALLILLADQLEAAFGPLGYTNPLFIPAVYSPGLAGLFLVWRHFGLEGLGSFLRRLTMWRMPSPGGGSCSSASPPSTTWGQP